ncbi:MAG: NADPH-dependent 7-cyano-7-deazaguanine reductase QueF [Pseudohongiella sp.]|nr:NADPH-dependent 7-cyano-7-deazaguanine reductase QueF [Pseudohongiella sp.]
MSEIPLGKQTDYPEHYNAEVLFPVSRSINRHGLGIGDVLPFGGFDHWRAYELSWLNSRGMPVVKMADILVPCESLCLIESKSLKLYFNSLNQHQFASDEQALDVIQRDLSEVAGAKVIVSLLDCSSVSAAQVSNPEYTVLLDSLQIDKLVYEPAPSLLEIDATMHCEEIFLSNLFRSRCPITAQPDWGTILIRYSGPLIDQQSLLRYIISYRKHSGFHENCVEQIFVDLNAVCAPTRLEISINFLRRGGLEINPFRTLFMDEGMRPLLRLCRQ